METRLGSRLKRLVSIALAATLTLQVMLGFIGQPAAQAQANVPNHLIIHQVYGGGGKDKTPITHSFIELYNPTADEVNLDGWKIEYSSARSGAQHVASTGGEWVSLTLAGTVPAYHSYLIQGAQEDAAPDTLKYSVVSFDLTWDQHIDNKQFNVRLLNGETVVDQLTLDEAIKDQAPAVQTTPFLDGDFTKHESLRRVNFQHTTENDKDFEAIHYRDINTEFIETYRPRSLADGAWGLAPVGGEEPGEGDTVIKIFHINDIHGRAGYDQAGQIGFAQFKTFIDVEGESADGSLVLDAGDTFHGVPFATMGRGDSIAQLVKEVGFDAISPGNHDFNYGVERLLELEELSGTPLLSANTLKKVDENGELLPKAEWTPLFERNTLIKEIDGIKVGVFGLTTNETAYKTNPNNVKDIDFGTDEEIVAAAQAAVDQLQEEGAQLIIALAHIGIDDASTLKSTDIAQEVDGIDVIIDGHSHSNFQNGRVVNGVMIASAGEHYKNVGVVTIGYNKEEEEKTAVSARTYAAAELTLDQYPENTEIKALYDAIAEDQEIILSEVVGATPIHLEGAREYVRSGETNLGRIITNAMLAESEADIAITNGGGIRASIGAGNVTKGNIIDVLPFGNFIVTKSLTGAQIKEAIEQGMTFGAGSFPHFAGMEVTVRKYIAVSGSTTVEKGIVEAITVNGEPMDMTRSYVVATNDFMAAGGDGYTVLQAPPVLFNYAALDEAAINYIGSLDAAEIRSIDAEQRLFVNADEGALSHLGSYSTGITPSGDGGIAEIVKYNPDNRSMYVVNGAVKQIDIVSLADLKNGANTFKLDKRVDVSGMIPGFEFGDVTSVDVSTEHRLIVAAVQERAYDKAGAVVLLDYDGNYVHHYMVGVQPDMVTFTPDGRYILTADEGEPRQGYGPTVIDPMGSVTIIDLANGIEQAEVNIVTFEAFDSQRDQLVADKVILKKDTAPSVDLEPEYIAVSSDSKTAYVSLQEANAIATLDIESGEFVSVKGLGFKNHNLPGNELDLFRDNQINIKTEEVYGVYMPDGLAVAEIDGRTYLLTPNEGDAREWGSGANKYANIRSASIGGRSFDALINEEHDGLEADKTYILGGRSFSIWDADTMELVFDSGSDFEKITAQRYPQYFNVSNDNLTLDHRSSKKGPEPEDVKVAVIDGKVYAAIGLERIGGVMMYDITNPADATFFDYINTRDYSAAIRGDVSPEGLAFVAAEHSPTGYPLLLAAHEVSGTVAVYQVNQGYVEPQPMLPFELNVQKSSVAGMASYQYEVSRQEGAPTYSSDYYVVVQVYEGTNTSTPGLVLIKKFAAGTYPANEEVRVGQSKKVKIMVVSSPDGSDAKVLADAYGVE